MSAGTNGTKPSARARRYATAGDSTPYKVGGGGRLFLPAGYGSLKQVLPKNLPTAPRARDRYLYITPRAESQWGSAVGIAVTKLSSWSWEIASSTTSRRRRLQHLLLTADYGHPSGVWGWVPFVERLGRDFLTTNNGAFFGIARASKAYGSRITGIYHLSSLRCRRTGDPDYPILYVGRDGRETPLKWYEVVGLVDCPEPDDIGYGMGFCAADRAYDQVKVLAALENYLYEKLTANSPTMLYILNGITQDQLDDLLADGEDEQAQAGAQSYMGAIIGTMVRPDQTPAYIGIQLAGLPDNASVEEVRARADLVYANALGMDVNEIRPQGGQAMGIGAQSQILDRKAKGKGTVSFRGQFHSALNWEVLDNRSIFFFNEKDLIDEERRSRVAATYGSALEKFVRNGSMSPRQGQEYLIERGIIPRRFANRDITGDPLSDTDKPDFREVEDTSENSSTRPVNEFVDPRSPSDRQTSGPHAPEQQSTIGRFNTNPPVRDLIDRTPTSTPGEG